MRHSHPDPHSIVVTHVEQRSLDLLAQRAMRSDRHSISALQRALVYMRSIGEVIQLAR